MGQESSVVDNTVTEATEEVVAEAKLYGWTPKEQFRGDPKNWVDAPEFVKRGRNSIPILRQKLTSNETEVRTLRQEVAQLKQGMKGVAAQAVEQANREWQAKYDALKAEKVKALEDDDPTKVVELDEQLAEHKATKPTVEDVAADPFENLPPDQKQWFTENAWYRENAKLRARANALSQGFKDDGLSGVALFEAVKAELRELFPDEMAEVEGHEPPTQRTNTPRTHRAGTRSRGNAGPQPGERCYENLPDEAKATCDKLVARKELTREQYVQFYKGDFK